MPSHRFQCVAPSAGVCDSSKSFEVDLPDELLDRSEVLRNAVSMAEYGPVRLELPRGSTPNFFDQWISLVLLQPGCNVDRIISVDEAMEGLQVRVAAGVCCTLEFNFDCQQVLQRSNRHETCF